MAANAGRVGFRGDAAILILGSVGFTVSPNRPRPRKDNTLDNGTSGYHSGMFGTQQHNRQRQEIAALRTAVSCASL